MSDDDIKTVLKQAIMGVEKGFFDSMGDKLVEKTLIQEEIAVSIVWLWSDSFNRDILHYYTLRTSTS